MSHDVLKEIRITGRCYIYLLVYFLLEAHLFCKLLLQIMRNHYSKTQFHKMVKEILCVTITIEYIFKLFIIFFGCFFLFFPSFSFSILFFISFFRGILPSTFIVYLFIYFKFQLYGGVINKVVRYLKCTLCDLIIYTLQKDFPY